VAEERDPRDARIEALERENAELRAQIAELKRVVEELKSRQRKDKRQAHPFARGQGKKDKGRAGRKPGHEGAFKPTPDHVDEEVEARLNGCPCCGGPVLNVEELIQYVIDLPEIRAHVLKILTERGWCRRCRKQVRTVHPRQVSKAGGAAAVALGPRATALVVELKHRQGVPYRDIAELFGRYFNLPVTHGALVQASVRLADKATGDYLALVTQLQHSGLVHSDETGWRIARLNAWLWVFCTDEITVYVIDYRRSSEVVLEVLGEDFAGRLMTDGLPALDALDAKGFHRLRCNSHIIRRCRDLSEVAVGRPDGSALGRGSRPPAQPLGLSVPSPRRGSR
jgi:transposase